MIKKSKKSQKSTSKKSTFGVSPLICVVAIIEVLVLIGVSTYAWFYIQASKVIGSGTISVAADSGLDIDFQYSNIDDYINIWNYVGSDFTFEPATSLDGRTIYFPTSGTFDNDTTATTVFRDGTVNDINSKYLSIDFELTNTSGYDQYVYLNNKSYFHVQDKNSDSYEESRALRLAFYQNDGNSGNVGSSLLNSGSSSDGGVINSSASSDTYTIYFDNTNSAWGTTPTIYAYFYDSDDSSSPEYHTAWPGVKMDRIAGQTYKVSIENPPTAYTQASGSFDANKTYYTKATVDGKDYYNVVKNPVAADFSTYYVATGRIQYDKIIITNNGSNDQRVTYSGKLTLNDNGKKFTTASNNPTTYSEHTVYFAKPYSWEKVYCHTWHMNGNTPVDYTTWPGDEMTYVGSGIYSYTYDSDSTDGFLFDDGTGGNDKRQTSDISVPSGGANGRLYYNHNNATVYEGGKTKYTTTYTPSYSSLQYRTIYFFNTHGWEKPYATVSNGQGSSVTTCDIALTSLSGNVYYCTVPNTVYNYVYFRAKEQVNDSYRTKQDEIVDNQVYRPKGDDAPYVLDNGHYYRDYDTFMYDRYIKKTGYPVISPGVSAGFQRPYSPVITIDAYSGEATEVVPAYSNSIDNYILGSGNELFVLKSNHMASLSMIMWLEGTDEACTGAAYAGKQIDMRLEFSTEYFPNGMNNESVIVNEGDSNSYIYNFYDKTREIWTSDRQSTESGVTVAPVMQLYDNTIKRGYLMSPSKYASYNGKQKVSCWSVSAPQSIARNGHDIIFRRVNPYNEDEVWNYWHAGPVAGDGSTVVDNKSLTVYSVAQSTTFKAGDTINFTAFADGSPTETNLIVAKYNEDNGTSVETLSSDTIASLRSTYSTYLSNADVPDESCGGLWGNHSVRMLTLMDGTNGHFFLNDHGVMTMNYSYPYKVGGSTQRTANIEYKASDDYGMLFYFVVPDVIYSENSGTALVTDVKFKRYYNFNYTGVTYAINSEKNNKILFDNKWNASTPKGYYYEIGQNYDNNHNLQYYSYWGSDILYVQTNNTSNPYLTTGSDNMIQLEFYKSSNTGTHKYVVCYAEQHFKGTDSNSWGYTAIVPCDADYDRYQVQYCYTNGGAKIYRSSSDATVYTSNVSSNTSTIDYQNTLYNTSTNKSEHICQISHFENIRIYFECNVGVFKTSSSQHFYPFGGSGNSWNWPGAQMQWRSDPYYGEYKRFYYEIDPNNYKKFIVSCNNGDWQAPEATFTPADNYAIYQCYYDNGNLVVRKNGNRDLQPGDPIDDYTKVMHLSLAAAVDWPHYSAQ